MTLHFLNDVDNEAESTQKPETYVMIASLKNETSLAMSARVLKALTGKLDIKRHSPSILYLCVLVNIQVKLGFDVRTPDFVAREQQRLNMQSFSIVTTLCS